MIFTRPIKRSVLWGVTLIAIAASLLTLSLAPAQTQEKGQNVRKPVDKLPSAAKRWAIIVGVGDYESSEINDLGGAANDAKALKDALIRDAGFPEEQVILLASDQPDQRKPKYPQIIRYLTNLKGLVPSDGLLLFAFSGHGVERGGRTYLLPADAQSSENIRLLERTGLPVDVVKEEIRATGVRQVLLILDSCRNDPAPGKGGGDNRVSDSFIRSFNFDLRNSEIDAFVTLHAASPGQRAYEYAEKRQGYFTWTLIEALRGRAANERGEVTLAGLLGYLEEKTPVYVRRDLGEQQRPYAIVEGYRANDLVLAVTAPPPIAVTTPNTVTAAAPEPTPATRMSVAGVPLAAMSFTTANVDAQGLVINRRTEQCWGYVEDLGDGVKLEMIAVSGGRFQMGSPSNESGRNDDEMQHWVRVSDFWIGRYEVTQAQWKAVMGDLPWRMSAAGREFKGDNLPVVNVGWWEAQRFCQKLNEKLKLLEGSYRLPTEAQWEFAARAGKPTPFAFGVADPTGPGSGSHRVSRGGGWANGAVYCRSAYRRRDSSISDGVDLGFRLVRVSK